MLDRDGISGNEAGSGLPIDHNNFASCREKSRAVVSAALESKRPSSSLPA